MLDMGFRPQVDRVLRDVPENRQTLLFSATLEGPVMDLARRYTSNAVHIRVELPAEHAHGQIEHRFVTVTPETPWSMAIAAAQSSKARRTCSGCLARVCALAGINAPSSVRTG